MAEDSGLIVALGRQIMNRACQDWAVWRDAGLDPPRLAINVSGRQLDEEGFVDDGGGPRHRGRPRPRLELRNHRKSDPQRKAHLQVDAASHGERRDRNGPWTISAPVIRPSPI
ncbi:MAG: EAL domain-containing protein [Betaproteobacteria bacterium]|nr:EAL domain-containing protein [Betaproteobacteria bacterium]